jgi:hypothetical protein
MLAQDASDCDETVLATDADMRGIRLVSHPQKSTDGEREEENHRACSEHKDG